MRPAMNRIVSAVEGIASPSNFRWVNAQDSSWSMSDVDDEAVSREGEVMHIDTVSLIGNDLRAKSSTPNKMSVGRRLPPRSLPPL